MTLIATNNHTNTDTDTNALLTVRGVCRRFISGGKSVEVLKNIHLDIHAGEFIAIVGSSGSGKSTLMNILGCLDKPSDGRYFVQGADTANMQADELANLRREYFGFIFQRYHLLNNLSAEDNVAIPAIYAGMASKTRTQKARHILGRLGLGEREHHKPTQLSGGQQQRVSIARALINGGEVILADEPTGALDSKSGVDVLNILNELNDDGHTIIMVTHDMEVAENAKRIIEIKDGEIINDRPSKRTMQDKQAQNPQNDQQTQHNQQIQYDQQTQHNKEQTTSTKSHDDDKSILNNTNADNTNTDNINSDNTNNDISQIVPSEVKGFTARKYSKTHQSNRSTFSTFSVSRFLEAFKMAIRAIIGHRMRSFLTMLGIIIGISSVVSIVALGKGSQAKIIDDMGNLGTNTIEIYPGVEGVRGSRQNSKLTVDDATFLASQHFVDSASPTVSKGITLRYGNQSLEGQVMGVGSQYFQAKNIQFSQGAGFTKQAITELMQYVVIDHKTAQSIYDNMLVQSGQQRQASQIQMAKHQANQQRQMQADNQKHPNGVIGHVILINNMPAKIIGVTAPKKDAMSSYDNGLKIYMPYTTVMGRLVGNRNLASITIRVKDTYGSKAAESAIDKLLTQRHGKKDYSLSNNDSVRQMIEKTTGSLTLLVSLIAVISLVVGGIGVMNIMLVSVTERIQEIGVRMAVGARQSDIMQQFLIEAVLLCLIGGIIGVLLSMAFGWVFSLFVKSFGFVYSPASIIMAFTCSSLIGIAFGFFPARRAARLDPVVALSGE